MSGTLDLFVPAASEQEAGRELRDDVLARLALYRAHTITQCRDAMVVLWRGRNRVDHLATVSGDDACRWLDEHVPSDRLDYRLVGAVFRPKSGWVYAGTVTSTLKRRHARRISTWQWEGA